MKADGAWLYRPGTAVRIDNDKFLGSPLPPDEPTAENPPSGAILDFYLPRAAAHVKLEILDAKNNVVRSFSSDDRKPEKTSQSAVADRWLSVLQTPGTAAGMHRLVWDLAWKASGEEEIDDFEAAALPGPRAVPGTYQVRLTVDGKSLVQPLTVVMDPRSSATSGELDQQLQLGQKMFAAATESQRALAEITAMQKQLSAAAQKIPQTNAELQSSVAQVRDEMQKILKGSGQPSGDAMGLERADSGLTAALKVVESSDRAVPSQGIELFEDSSHAMKLRLEEWNRLKTNRLPHLNDQLKQAHVAPLIVSQADPSDADPSQVDPSQVRPSEVHPDENSVVSQ